MDGLPPLSSGEELASNLPQNALLDFFFPGFSVFSTAAQKYLHIDLNLYIPLVILFGGAIFVWRYFSEYFSDLTESYFMSVVDIRIDDEIYNMLMAWVANQRFAQGARRFVVNTNLNSRSWFLWRWDYDEDEDEEGGQDEIEKESSQKKTKALAYTPTFGSHWFIYKGRLLVFRRTQNKQTSSYLTASEREEISIACFGRNPWVLKELLHEARQEYLKRDEAKTLIYRGTAKSGTVAEPVWQRCMARTSRPFSTVIINEKVKKDLIDDVTDYLNPATRRWYSNRGIPYRRGYLLYGPPGTGKSSLSLALAGFFKMRIYIVSLSSAFATEENLASLFAELPRRCVVLLEDIDTAGLTHTREDENQANANNDNSSYNEDEHPNASSSHRRLPGNGPNNGPIGRLSLSGLLNILDGVASQEGRVLIMTTNHIEKLDKALIRPGRVDMIVKFDRADTEMTAAIFRAIYAPLEEDDVPTPATSPSGASTSASGSSQALFQLERTLKSAASKLSPAEETKREAEAADAARKKDEIIAKVDALAKQFASKIPAHEFSPAEIQGFLLKNKRSPENAVEGAEQWVADTRKEKKEKELKEAEEKRKAEEKAKKEKEEEEKKKNKKKKKKDEEKESGDEDEVKGKKTRKGKKGKKESRRKASSISTKKSKSRRRKEESEGEDSDSAGSSSSSSSSSSGAESESESERETVTASKKRSRPAAEGKEKPSPVPTVEVKVEPVVVPAPPAITIDTVKAREAALEVQQTPQGADSGYGTP
ncbi:Mitochondrial chaperone BCS1 [Madurella fahalii]|uniref:Mitochondrial chaperone BCS1 n=1 Tax=Madurella fahalii TaxID=1157608 RepID=A0ABQ0GDM7_9PEZI